MMKSYNVSKKLNISIIGFGGMAGWHFKNLIKCGLFNVIGVYDIDKERLTDAKNKGLIAYNSAEELLKEPSLDIVLIATPNDVHEEYVVLAANANKNVICEKPVTLSSKSLEKMIETAKNNNVLFMVHQNRRWDKDYLIIKELYRSAEMGAMYKADSNVTGSHGVPGSWRREKAKGGGMLWDWGVHLIDQMLCLVDSKVVGVTCKGSFVYGLDCDDGILMTIEFENGFVANINIDTNKFIETPRWYAYGLDGTAIVKGWNCKGEVIKVKTFNDAKNKGITAGNGFTKTMAERSKSSVIKKKLPKIKEELYPFYKNYYDCLVEGAKPVITLDSVMRCMMVMEAGFLSMEEQKTIITDI